MASRMGVQTPDDVLLRRFGHVRAVGGAAYIVAVVALLVIFGARAWPLALGVPVLVVVTTAYFTGSRRYPRLAVAASLVADAVVLAGAIAFFGGSGSGLALLYAIVVVSAGILLGPTPAIAFTVLSVAFAALQLAVEQMGLEPVLLHRPELNARVPILLASVAGIVAVGYLAATYASRLHQLVSAAGAEAEVERLRGRRRRSYVRQAAAEVARPLLELEGLADRLDEGWDRLSDDQRRALAAELRTGVTRLEADVGLLADVGALDALSDTRPEPVALRGVVDDCVRALDERLAGRDLDIDVPPLKVVGDRRAARRVIFNLLENVADHTPAGGAVRIAAVARGDQGVLAVTDSGPGVDARAVEGLFKAPDDPHAARVGLPVVAELCEAMGAEVYYEPASPAGARFVVAFRLAPPSAPSADDRRLTGFGQAAR